MKVKRTGLLPSIQQQVLLVFFLLGMALVTGAYAVMAVFVLPTFEKLELEQNLEYLGRIDSAIESRLQGVWTYNLEYSSWDDSVDFMLQPGMRASYIQENLTPEFWQKVGNEFMLFLDNSGQLVWGQVIDPRKSTPETLMGEQRLSQFVGGHSFLAAGKSFRGIIDTPMGLAFIASNPILRSDGSGPSPGVLLNGRFFTAKRAAELSDGIAADVAVHRLADPQSQEFETAFGELFAKGGAVLTEIAGRFMIGRKLIEDVFGNPVAVIETRAPAKISETGVNVVKTALIFLSMSILLFTFFTWLFLRMSIIGPVAALKNHIIRIRESGDLHAFFGSKRQDEIGTLATEFDSLACRLGKTQEQLENARDDAEASSRAKSEFLATMSHEIRTPLNGVIGMTEVLLRSGLAERQQHLAETVKSSGRLLLNIINDILDFSRMSANMLLIDKKTFPVRRLVEEVNSVMAESAQDKGLEYLCSVDKAVPQFVIADDQRLRQVLINLIGNAIKFTREGEVLFSIAVVDVVTEGGETGTGLEFKVADTGLGVREQALSTIFESFAQADSGTTREFGGTGLGLAICKQLVEQMGGSIGVSSVFGEGSEFYFTLPVEVVAEAGVSDACKSGRLENLNILVVDDNATNREILLSHARQWNAHCDAAASAAEALQIMNAGLEAGKRYDVLLVDYHMPVMDGLCFAKIVWNDSRYCKPSMLMLSSVADDFTAVDLQNHGVVRYLTKPVLEDALYQQICRALDDRAVVTETKSAQAESTEEPLLANMDVLVAEDNQVNQELVFLLLEELGARVEIANHGQEAIASLESASFDLVIMDCHMPVLDGFEATRRIRDRGFYASGGWPLPILAMTANAMTGDRKKCLDAGMDEYISKPFDYNDLLAVLGTLLPGRTNQTTSTEDLMPDRAAVSAALEREALEDIKALQSGSTSILGRLIQVYLDTSPELLEKIELGVAGQDQKSIELYAHSLKSSSARFGADKLAGLCKELELKGRSGALDGSSKLLGQLQAEFRVVCCALSRELENA